MNVDVLGLIIVPVVLFILGAAYGGIRGIIRFAQYLVRTEEAQDSMARSMSALTERLGEHIDKTDRKVSSLDRRLTVVEFAIDKKKPRGEVDFRAGVPQDDQ